ncbi:MAG: thermonuclease family protein [Bosea sp.]|nr:thermonuclease family protein [Bosea sp. (in: a-proteobacteria)]MBN9471077.1 thermonuclease family protein [Bosea sp. (in: a-proteobacteria)]
MSTVQWAVVCGCSFIIALGAGLGLLTPSPQRLDELRRELLPSEPQKPADQAATRSIGTVQQVPFRICGRGAGDCVVDGDTFWYRAEKIRIADIDAPETEQAKCSSERALGDRAKHRLAELLSEAPFSLEGYGSRDRDRYGRLLRVVYQNGRSVGQILVAEGLARPWHGRRRPWC